MKIDISCPACGRAYVVDSGRVPAGGTSVRCSSCGASIGVIEPAVEKTPPPVPMPSADVVCPRCGLHFVPSGATVDSSRSKSTVLVVEDNPFFVESARDALKGRFEIRTVSTVRDALSTLRSEAIDLVLLDIVLENGEDGLRLLRELPVKPCPVLIFTAQDESEMYGDKWESLRALGADDVVFKGMNMGDALVRKVSEVLGEGPEGETLRD